MVSVSEERLGAIRTVQAFNAVQPTETKYFGEKVNKIFELAKKEAWASGAFSFLPPPVLPSSILILLPLQASSSAAPALWATLL